MASRYAGERVRRSVAIFCCTVEIARHPRSYDRGEFRFRTQTLPGTARTKARRARPGSALIYKVLLLPRPSIRAPPSMAVSNGSGEFFGNLPFCISACPRFGQARNAQLIILLEFVLVRNAN